MQEGKRRTQLPFRVLNLNDQSDFPGACAVMAIWAAITVATVYIPCFHGRVVFSKYRCCFATVGTLVLSQVK